MDALQSASVVAIEDALEVGSIRRIAAFDHFIDEELGMLLHGGAELIAINETSVILAEKLAGIGWHVELEKAEIGRFRKQKTNLRCLTGGRSCVVWVTDDR